MSPEAETLWGPCQPLFGFWGRPQAEPWHGDLAEEQVDPSTMRLGVSENRAYPSPLSASRIIWSLLKTFRGHLPVNTVTWDRIPVWVSQEKDHLQPQQSLHSPTRELEIPLRLTPSTV